ncbi:hypothetical protein BK135_00855 [Paenibacillus peoriae]|nr:hypothetical protein BK135_00855 [Paenibacillus peoriae]
MDALTSDKKFNFNLVGYPVYVTGEDSTGQLWARFFLVQSVTPVNIGLTNNYGGYVLLCLDEIVSKRLKIMVWDGGLNHG